MNSNTIKETPDPKVPNLMECTRKDADALYKKAEEWMGMAREARRQAKEGREGYYEKARNWTSKSFDCTQDANTIMEMLGDSQVQP